MKNHSFEALDECHRQIQIHLDELNVIAKKTANNDLDEKSLELVKKIQQFFSSVSRKHHSDEEEEIFPKLLKSENLELVATVRSLIQDHFWIEKYWIDLEPQLQAISSGDDRPNGEAFQRSVDLFLELCNLHIEVEERLIYPKAKLDLV